jgi:putative DNA primase/helicase
MAEIRRIDDIRRLTQERIEAEKATKAEKNAEKPQSKNGDSGGEIPLDFIEKCLDCNEIGDSLIYNRLHRGKFVNNVSVKEARSSWMVFENHIWKKDVHQKAKAAVEAVVNLYLLLMEKNETDLKEIENSEEKKFLAVHLKSQKEKILRRVNKLRSDKGRSAVLACAISNSDPLTVEANQFNLNPWLFPCKNGVHNLKTGIFADGRPEDYITLTSGVERKDPGTPCPTWIKFINDIFDGDQEIIEYFQKVIGYAMTGLDVEHIFVILHGPHGQNGKGIIAKIIGRIFGEMGGSIKPEMLMDQKFGKSPDGPSPSILFLRGKRFVYASEPSKRDRFSEGKIKFYSGGDKLKGRDLNDREENEFDPTHTMFLLCNYLPTAPPDDDAFWTRMRRFTFKYSYVPNPKKPHERLADPFLEDKLMAEIPGIYEWIFEGCLKWQQSGIIPPQKIMDDTEEYRAHEDDLQEFIDDCCAIDWDDHSKDNRTSANDLYKRYKTWWQDRSAYKCMPQKEFSDQLKLKGFDKIKSDKIFYQYIKLVFTFDQE